MERREGSCACEGTSFCIVGEQGSGKGVISAHLQGKFPGHRVIRSGPLWDEVVGRPLTHYERTVIQKKIIEEKGEKYFVDFMIGKIKDLAAKDGVTGFIVDGIRSREVFDALKEYFGPKIVFIGVLSDKKVRYGRMVERDGPDSQIDDREDMDERQFGLKGLVDRCDVKMTNNYSEVEPLYRDIDDLLQKYVEV